MSKFEMILYQLDACLSSKFPTIFSTLRAGAEPPLKMGLSSELEEFYYWHNGQCSNNAVIGQQDFNSFGKIIPIESAVEYLKDFSKKIQNKPYLPIMESQAGDFLLVDRNRNKSKVYLFSPELTFNNFEVVFSNLESLLITTYMCYENNIYTLSQDQFLEVDTDREALIARKYNKGIKYWD